MLCKHCKHEIIRYNLMGVSGYWHSQRKTKDNNFICFCDCDNPEPYFLIDVYISITTTLKMILRGWVS